MPRWVPFSYMPPAGRPRGPKGKGVPSPGSQQFMDGLVILVFMFLKAMIFMPVLLLSMPAWPAAFVCWRRGIHPFATGTPRFPMPENPTGLERACIYAGRPFAWPFFIGVVGTLAPPAIM